MELFYHELLKKKIKMGSQKRVLNKEQYNKWVYRMVRECNKVTNLHPQDVYDILNSTYSNIHIENLNGFCLSYDRQQRKIAIVNVKSGKKGWSKCLKYDFDNYNANIALAIAWARYCKNDIPICEETLTRKQIKSLKSGTILYDTISGLKMKFVGIDPMNDENIIVWVFQDESRCSLESIVPYEDRYSFEIKRLFEK